MKGRGTAHEPWMTRALQLARRGEWLTRPNPPVGAVVVKNGRIVGEGYHRRAGGPHAEIVALRRAGRQARGGTLYVTLEPCSTWGRTPPCTDAILASGVRHVVVSATDPNPRHAGRGLRFLRRKGVRVTKDVCRAEGLELIEPFARWVEEGRPFVTLKLAMTVDGRIADRTGNSRWLSSPASRRRVQGLRRAADGILVGRGTVKQDNPSLLPRPSGGRRPFRLVAATRGDIPRASNVLCDGHAAQTIVFVGARCGKAARSRLDSQGCRVVLLPQNGRRIALRSLLRWAGRLGLLQVLCEGGGEMAASLMNERLVDRYIFFITPCALGGGESIGAIGGRGWLIKKGMPALRFVSCRRVGPDVMIEARPK